MNGDFLDLLPRNALPALRETDPAAAGIEATPVFAFHCAAGALIAGDHRATSGNLIFSDRTEKILELDRYSVMAIAGSPAIAFEMARTLQTAFEYYRRSQLQAMSLLAKTRAISRLLKENLPAALQGVGIVAPIFAGLEPDREESRPMIYYYDPLGANFEAAHYAGSGSGSGSIKSVLHYTETWGGPKPSSMDLPAAVNFANRLLMTAAKFDTATGGVEPEKMRFGTIKLLSGDGIRTVSDEEQGAFWTAGD
jgi:proteasome beta subunit